MIVKPDSMSDDNFLLLKSMREDTDAIRKEFRLDLKAVNIEVTKVTQVVGGIKTDVTNIKTDVDKLRQELNQQKEKLEHMEKAGPADLDFRAYLADLRKEIDYYICTIHVYDVPPGKETDLVRTQGCKLKIPKDL